MLVQKLSLTQNLSGTNTITLPSYINLTSSSTVKLSRSLVTLTAPKAHTTIPLDPEQPYLSHNPIDLFVASARRSLASS